MAQSQEIKEAELEKSKRVAMSSGNSWGQIAKASCGRPSDALDMQVCQGSITIFATPIP